MYRFTYDHVCCVSPAAIMLVLQPILETETVSDTSTFVTMFDFPLYASKNYPDSLSIQDKEDRHNSQGIRSGCDI